MIILQLEALFAEIEQCEKNLDSVERSLDAGEQQSNEVGLL